MLRCFTVVHCKIKSCLLITSCLGFGSSALFFFVLSLVVDSIAAVVGLSLAVGLGGIAISGTFSALSVFLCSDFVVFRFRLPPCDMDSLSFLIP